MSMAGILASTLLQNPLSQVGQNPSAASQAGSLSQAGWGSGSTSFLAALQQRLPAQISGSASTSSAASAALTQLGEDLESGNLPSAQADFASLESIWSHGHNSALSHGSRNTGAGSSAGTGSQSATPAGNIFKTNAQAAWQAYNSLQQNPLAAELGESLGANANPFAADL